MSQVLDLLFLCVFLILYTNPIRKPNGLQEDNPKKCGLYQNVAKIQQYEREKRSFIGFCGVTLEITPCVLTFSVSIKSHKCIISFLQHLVKHL